MFIINTPDGPVDVDNEAGRQNRYNRMMTNVLKEKEMLFYRMEIDFEKVKISFTTFQAAKDWVEIALSTGAEIVTIWYDDKMIRAYS